MGAKPKGFLQSPRGYLFLPISEPLAGYICCLLISTQAQLKPVVPIPTTH